MKPKYSSNSGIFAKRGDPWVSEKQGQRDFGRNVETEDPDFDAQNFARKAQPKPQYVDPKPKKNDEPDYARRRAAIAYQMQRELRKNKINVK